MTGAINIITKPPRESVGSTLTLTSGWTDRSRGSTADRRAGSLFGANATVTRAPTDRLAYRISAGYFASDAYARPTGQIPVIADPRADGQMVGGGYYPLDGAGPFGAAFANRGTRQPKFDVRVDQELTDGLVTYAAGVAGTEGIVHTGTGPFDIQRGSTLGYGQLTYSRGNLRAQVFTNFMDGTAPNLLLPDPATGRALELGFNTQTFDAEIEHSTTLGQRHVLNYGANVRRNNFDITIAPNAENRLEAGVYVQDEIFLDPVRLVLGGRVDKFGSLDRPVFSPRMALIYKPAVNHSVTVSFNRAFRGPSLINDFLHMQLVSPQDLSSLAPLLPPPFRPAVARPFPLVVQAVGGNVPFGQPRSELREESLTAYEVSYTGTVARGTTTGVAFYINTRKNAINFVPVAPSADPYTAANPPPGWPLPPFLLGALGQQGIFLPRTAFTYANLGPLRHRGMELWLDQPTVAHRLSLGQLLVAVRAEDPGCAHTASDIGTQPAPRASVQHRHFLGRKAPPGQHVGEHGHERVLVRRVDVAVPRLLRRLCDGERQHRHEVAERRGHDAAEIDQHLQPARSAAPVRRLHRAHGDGRSALREVGRRHARGAPRARPPGVSSSPRRGKWAADAARAGSRGGVQCPRTGCGT